MKKMTRKQRRLRLIAYHEAGHAVACSLLGFRFRRVSIIHDHERGFLGHVQVYKPTQKTMGLDHQCLQFPSLADARLIARRHEKVMYLLAGMQAVRLFIPGSKFRSCARQDVRVAKQILVGLHPADEAQLVYRWLVLRTRRLLVDDPFARPGIEALAAALIEKQEMSGKEAKRVIGEAFSKLLRTRREHPKQQRAEARAFEGGVANPDANSQPKS